MIVYAHNGDVLLTLSHDKNEYWATSSLRELTTVGEIRHALSEIQDWAEGNHSSCFADGYRKSLYQWIAHSLHGMRKLDDRGVLSSVPRKVESTWDEIASYAYNLHRVTDLPVPPHMGTVSNPV